MFAVSWGDAARSAIGCKIASRHPGEAAGSTETGAYMLNGATSYGGLMAKNRNAAATYFIPLGE